VGDRRSLDYISRYVKRASPKTPLDGAKKPIFLPPDMVNRGKIFAKFTETYQFE
jgi:hypothetical protein